MFYGNSLSALLVLSILGGSSSLKQNVATRHGLGKRGNDLRKDLNRGETDTQYSLSDYFESNSFDANDQPSASSGYGSQPSFGGSSFGSGFGGGAAPAGNAPSQDLTSLYGGGIATAGSAPPARRSTPRGGSVNELDTLYGGGMAVASGSGGSSPSPSFSAPAAPSFSAPAAPSFSAPAAPSFGSSFGGGAAPASAQPSQDLTSLYGGGISAAGSANVNGASSGYNPPASNDLQLSSFYDNAFSKFA